MTPQNDLITIPTIEDVTRRQFMSGALAAALLVACGDDEEEAAPQAMTRTVTHELGTSVIPAEPQRVVVLDGRPDFEHALVMGFKPVAVGDGALVEGKLLPGIEFDMDGVLILQFEVDYEALLAVSPDLILGRTFAIKPQYDRLSQIAPVVPFKHNDSWRSQLERVSRWLGREKQAAEALEKYEEKVAAVRQRHGEKITSSNVGIVQWMSSGRTSFYSFTPANVHYQTLTDLGATVAATPPEFSIEHANELAGVDALLVVTGDLTWRQALESNPVWQTVPAVQRGSVLHTDLRSNFGGFYAAMNCLDLFDQLYSKLG